ncbi:uncharacterized protein LOC126204336 [Schistocerca nitens]|uniref:uncharacterized protein LOC126204336 n=1 Tax=Schistocerca nitens TaxID=7011 RepID=UPI002118C725|nr:uncharacterized protein LOC126204336 [Schistocerca nitens]
MASSLDAAPSPASATSSAGGLPPTPTSSTDSSGRCGIDSGIDAAALRRLDRAHGASGPPSRGTSPRAPRQRQASPSPRPSSALDMPDISDAVNVSEHSDFDSLDGHMDDSDIAEGLEEHLTALRDAAEEEGLQVDPVRLQTALFPNMAAATADSDAGCGMEFDDDHRRPVAARRKRQLASSSDSEAPPPADRGLPTKKLAIVDAEGFQVPRKTAPRRRFTTSLADVPVSNAFAAIDGAADSPLTPPPPPRHQPPLLPPRPSTYNTRAPLPSLKTSSLLTRNAPSA